MRTRHTVVLHTSNNVVAWLRPSDVVVKICVGHYDRAGDELAIAERLALRGAPIVGPAPGVEPRVHRERGYEMTFWQHQPARGRRPSHRAIATSLSSLHDALESLKALSGHGPPTLLEVLRFARRALDQPILKTRLGSGDRELLVYWLGSGASELTQTGRATQVLHGSPHDGNYIAVDGQPRFIDFETVCTGPLEWDLAHVDDRVAAAYSHPHDAELLARCRTVVSAQVAVWCWLGIERSPELRWHAEHHLAEVRRASVGVRPGS